MNIEFTSLLKGYEGPTMRGSGRHLLLLLVVWWWFLLISLLRLGIVLRRVGWHPTWRPVLHRHAALRLLVR
jgi:hypothetical protein